MLAAIDAAGNNNDDSPTFPSAKILTFQTLTLIPGPNIFPGFQEKIFGNKIYRQCVKLWAIAWIHLNMNPGFS